MNNTGGFAMGRLQVLDLVEFWNRWRCTKELQAFSMRTLVDALHSQFSSN